MKLSETVRSISYLKAHAAELLEALEESQGTLVITQNGEAKAVLQDIRAWERLQESLAMLKILTLSQNSIRAGKGLPMKEAFRRVRERIRQVREE